MMEQPRNCLFCHKSSVERPVYLDEIHQFNGRISPELMYQCRCTYCGAKGPIKGTKRAAIKAWNRRTENG